MVKTSQLPVLIALVSAVILVSGCVRPLIDMQNMAIEFYAPPELSEGTVGVYYEYSFCDPETARSGATCGGLAGATVNPTGGSPPYSIIYGSGLHPPGINLQLNGLFAGTPTVPGDYSFEVCARDGASNQECNTVFLRINPAEDMNQTEAPTIPETPEEPVSPPVSPEVRTANVAITSGSCAVVEMYGPQFSETYRNLGMNYARVYEVHVSGSMEGSEGTELHLTTFPIIAYTEPVQLSCGGWEKDSYADLCTRTATSTAGPIGWSYVTKAFGEQVQPGFTVTVHATVSIDGVVMGEATYPIQCPTVQY